MRNSIWFNGVLAIILTAASVHAVPPVVLGRPCDRPGRPALDRIDHSSFDALLQKYVDERCLVDYRGWQSSPEDVRILDEYLLQVGCVDLSRATETNAQLAYWLNVYNAVTLKGILLFYPTTSIRRHVSHLGGFNIWKHLQIWVDGRLYSLDDIEHSILRKIDARIHFGAVCASRGCPPLRNRAFTSAKVLDELHENARLFFAQSGNFRVEPATRTVYISELIKWYGGDFASTPAEQVQKLLPFFPHAEALDWVAHPGVKVKFLRYDWGLNDQHPLAPTLRDRLSPWNW